MKQKIVGVSLLVLVLGACGPATLTPSPPAQLEITPLALATSGAEPIADDRATELMYELSEGSLASAGTALDAVLDADDERFVAVLIELLRFSQIGILRGAGYDTQVAALEALSGQDFGDNWPDWIEWYGTTTLAPPPGFTGWKGSVLAKIDPGFAEFLQDGAPSAIRVEEIQWGGVAVDGIPALDQPEVVSPELAEYLTPEEPVFGIALNGEARAYPLRILDWHEMANIEVGGIPISLAYCTLCGAGIAFDGRASDGNTYDFGSSGFLFRSNKLMYDRQTRTLWNQLTGEPVLGKLVGQDVRLEVLPIVLTSWADWLAQHPETLVLSIQTGYNRTYELGAAYGDYFAFYDTMFPVWQRSDLLDTKDRVFALQIEGQAKAYPIDALVDEQVINDDLAGQNLVLIASRGEVLVNGSNVRVGDVRYAAGAEVRAYMRGEQIFTLGSEPDELIDQNGAIWQVTEAALISPDGLELPRIGGHLAYWFGWYSFFPKTIVYGID